MGSFERVTATEVGWVPRRKFNNEGRAKEKFHLGIEKVSDTHEESSIE